MYQQLQVIDGVLYLVTNDLEQCQNSLEILNVELNGEENTSKTDIETEGGKHKAKHVCPREDCTKVYSTPNQLKVKLKK